MLKKAQFLNSMGIIHRQEKEDRMKLRTIEMPKVDLNKPLEDMNEQEKMIYYFLNCHKGLDDSKIPSLTVKKVKSA